MPKRPMIALRLLILAVLGLPVTFLGVEIVGFVLRTQPQRVESIRALFPIAWAGFLAITALLVKLNKGRAARIAAHTMFGYGLVFAVAVTAFSCVFLVIGPSSKVALLLMAQGGVIYGGLCVEGIIAMRRWRLGTSQPGTPSGMPARLSSEVVLGLALALLAAGAAVPCALRAIGAGMHPWTFQSVVEIQGGLLGLISVLCVRLAIGVFRRSRSSRMALLILLALFPGFFIAFPFIATVSRVWALAVVLICPLACAFLVGEDSANYCDRPSK